MYDCRKDGPLSSEQRSALINRYELGISRHVLLAGYRIGTITGIQREYDRASAFDSTCPDVWNQRDLHRRITAENMTFWKVTRQFPIAVREHAARQEKLLQERLLHGHRRSRSTHLITEHPSVQHTHTSQRGGGWRRRGTESRGQHKEATRISPAGEKRAGDCPPEQGGRGRETSHIHSPLFESQVLSFPKPFFGARPIGLSKK